MEVYDKEGAHLFNLPQNLLADLFIKASSPYEEIGALFSKNLLENGENTL